MKVPNLLKIEKPPYRNPNSLTYGETSLRAEGPKQR